MTTLRRSMTGYGAGTAETTEFCVTVEIKAVNQRFLEISPHMPRAFGAWENDLRDLIRTHVARGKLDVYVNFEDRSEKQYDVHVNEGLARAYYAALGKVARAVDAPLKILDCVLSWTWISKPITVSQVMVIRFLFLLNDDWTMKTRAAFARRFHPAWHSGGGTTWAFCF